MFVRHRRWVVGWIAAALLLLPTLGNAQYLVDINAATVEELQTLPGIGEVKAQAIVDYRSEHGPFASIDELTSVRGIGNSTLANIRDRIMVDGGGAEAQRPRETVEFHEEPVIDLTEDPGTSIGPPSRERADRELRPPREVPPPPAVEEPPVMEEAPTLEEPAATEEPPEERGTALINVNTAEAELLQTLPGIGPSKANAIIEYRNANGPFQSIDELNNVPGIGPSTMNNIRDSVTIE